MPPKKSFPLPRASQANYTKYFKHTVGSGPLIRYRILWVGQPLDCRFKSDDLKATVGPHNVFILKKGASFEYALVDNTESVHRLPKKYFSTCFPGVQYTAIPPDNMIKIKITRNESIEVPYIPTSFLQQKRLKTTSSKRKRSHSLNDESRCVEAIDFGATHPEWHVLTNSQIRDDPNKRRIMCLIRMLIQHADVTQGYIPTDPFDGIVDLKDLLNDTVRTTRLKTILGFIVHYCRSEMGCHPPRDVDARDLQRWIECLNDAETV